MVVAGEAQDHLAAFTLSDKLQDLLGPVRGWWPARGRRRNHEDKGPAMQSPPPKSENRRSPQSMETATIRFVEHAQAVLQRSRAVRVRGKA